MKQLRLTEISFIFVPEHTGVRGNERADRLAGIATVVIRRAMDWANSERYQRGLNRLQEL